MVDAAERQRQAHRRPVQKAVRRHAKSMQRRTESQARIGRSLADQPGMFRRRRSEASRARTNRRSVHALATGDQWGLGNGIGIVLKARKQAGKMFGLAQRAG